jgi:competence protein ComEC
VKLFTRHAKWVIVPLAVVAVLVWVAAAMVPEGGNLSVSFLDVGQGDSILITGPSGQRVLVDGGPSPERACLDLGEALPFWERSIDLVVLTHAHSDHVTGLVEVLRRYDVGRVLYSDYYPVERASDSDYDSEVSPAYAEFCDTVAEENIDCTAAQAGQSIDLSGGATIEVLNPPDTFLEGTDSDADNNAVVLRVEMGNVSFLLTSDLYWDGELYLVAERANLESTVLKASHHGSSSSTYPAFLTAVDPQVAVVSVGADNRFGHPTEEVMERLVDWVGDGNVYLTSERGTVTFTTDGEHLWVETER